jgi:hypothetical protein
MLPTSIFETNLTPLETVENVTRAHFDAVIRPAGKPVILKNLVGDWPSVKAGASSLNQLGDYLKSLDIGATTPTFLAPPEVKGRYFYTDDMRKFTFESREVPLRATIDKLLDQQNDPAPLGIYAGASPTVNTLPRFGEGNPMPLLDPYVVPKVWISNSARVAPHFDISENIACLVSGERSFVVFPPEQIENLYVGPIDYNMAGQPASMVDPINIDHDRFPKFKTAMQSAQIATLEPGDAVYLPSLWWHYVDSKGPLNVLVNYWWDALQHGSPMNVLALALLVLRDLPQNDRTAWETVFKHYVFGQGADTAIDHIPEAFRGVLGSASPERDMKIKTFLRAKLPSVLG